jgi:hypothetical protein
MLTAPNPKSTMKKLQDQAMMMPFGQGLLADIAIRKRKQLEERGLTENSEAAEDFKTGFARKYGKSKQSLFNKY